MVALALDGQTIWLGLVSDQGGHLVHLGQDPAGQLVLEGKAVSGHGHCGLLDVHVTFQKGIFRHFGAGPRAKVV